MDKGTFPAFATMYHLYLLLREMVLQDAGTMTLVVEARHGQVWVLYFGKGET